jgi:hypothetical protein
MEKRLVDVHRVRDAPPLRFGRQRDEPRLQVPLDRAASGIAVGRFAERRQHRRSPLALEELAHQIDDAVDESPGPVAADRGEQKLAHSARSFGNIVARQQRKPEDHDEPAENLGDPIEGIEVAGEKGRYHGSMLSAPSRLREPTIMG